MFGRTTRKSGGTMRVDDAGIVDMRKENMKTQAIDNAKKFFEKYITIAGELELYKILFGELPTTDDTMARIKEYQRMARDSEPLMKELNKYFEKGNHDHS